MYYLLYRHRYLECHVNKRVLIGFILHPVPTESNRFNRCDVIYDTQHCSREWDLLVLHPVPQTGTLEGCCHWCHRCKILFQQPSDSCDSLTSMIDCILGYSFGFIFKTKLIIVLKVFWREALITLLSKNGQTMTPRKANRSVDMLISFSNRSFLIVHRKSYAITSGEFIRS